MKTFYDHNKVIVNLSFHRNYFKQKARHVLVICKYQQYWLLTHHKKRGLEFPGGKAERGESTKEAAYREVYEETGAKISVLEWIASYQVMGLESFVKDVYFANISELEIKDDYLETLGPVLIEENILEKRWEDFFSYVMKDDVLELCIPYIEKQFFSEQN
ncbi:RNA deprotection pyrophosphohydrolase [Bacillus sp. B1-b2]|uniref:RNA deprotection pyrophosphohydrolase n=1 Tax=Bacillus sp. B1-b2 TaxID=2653201 RepID=UPI001261F744|nr:nucleoside triphosphatase YtkD [Bacillus sp. B1-b2]KAB7666813.1 nucleoside triphosphatase YtkD [Bacillus sp. B1-b2]